MLVCSAAFEQSVIRIKRLRSVVVAAGPTSVFDLSSSLLITAAPCQPFSDLDVSLRLASSALMAYSVTWGRGLMFSGWENFYALIGSAAGALIGIMFLVSTLT